MRTKPAKHRSTGQKRAPTKGASLLVRVDAKAKTLVQRAADARGLTVSDYVRTLLVAQAQRDVDESETGVLRLAREDQLALWQALQHPPAPTEAQKALGRRVRKVLSSDA
jgi:uncharacterized protein (DUF1778 family)